MIYALISGNFAVKDFTYFLLLLLFFVIRMGEKLFVEHKQEHYCFIRGGFLRIAGIHVILFSLWWCCFPPFCFALTGSQCSNPKRCNLFGEVLS